MNKTKKEQWPNLFIVGAAKAGTTSLYTYLSQIPEIFMSERKEPHHFSINMIPKGHFIYAFRDEKEYLKLFQKAKEQKIIGEASTSYLPDPEAPKLIFQKIPDAKIIIMLRDPVERAYSHYLMNVRGGKIKRSFHDQLLYDLQHDDIYEPQIRLKMGLYYDSVKRYLDIFGKKQVKVIIFEEFIKNEKKTVKDVLKYLNVDSALENFKGEVFNAFAVPRGDMAEKFIQSKSLSKIVNRFVSHEKLRALKAKYLFKKIPKPEMSKQDREILVEFYKENVKKLKILLNRDLSWKNFES